MAALSPRPSIPTQSSLSSDNMRPNLMKRQSSASSHNSSKHGALSPGSLEQHHQPQRHHVKPAKKGRPGVVLPLTKGGHGSGRNLVKMAHQAQTQHLADEGRKRSREKSRESEGESGRETEIRLPGSLDEGRIRFAEGGGAAHLPRNTSHTKLKKNLSHGQLTRLGLERNNSGKGPPSPGLKGRSKRPKSADMLQEQNLHEQEVELAAAQRAEKKDAPKKVGFAVGSEPSDDEEGLPNMEGSGLQGEDEWTDQSASASPYSTRQNTANNSRRASMVHADKPPEGKMPANTDVVDLGAPALKPQATAPLLPPAIPKVGILTDGSTAEESDGDDDNDETSEDEREGGREGQATVEGISPGTIPAPHSRKETQQQQQQQQPVQSTPTAMTPSSSQQPQQRSLIHEKKEKDYANPAARRLLSRNATPSPAPALVSNVSALDDARSARTGSPAPSMQSLSRETSHVQQGDGSGIHESGSGELVSRFMPSASHPNGGSGSITKSFGGGGGSGPSTTMNTPKTGSIHTPDENDGVLAQDHETSPSNERKSGFSIGPTSPGSAGLSTSHPRSLSSTSTLAYRQPFRNETRMQNEKTLSLAEEAATFAPIIPGHVFDRRNESLKSYLNLAMLGGDGRGGLNSKTGLPTDGTVGSIGSVHAGAGVGRGTIGTGPGAGMGMAGAKLFEGRFKAVNAELKVVQRFRDPIGESIERLKNNKAVDFNRLRGVKGSQRQQTAATAAGGKLGAKSKSAVQLQRTTLPRQSSKLSTSASPPKNPEPATLMNSKSSSHINAHPTRPAGSTRSNRSKVSFSGSVAFAPSAGTAAAAGEVEGVDDKSQGRTADEIARRLWESIG